MTDSERSPEGPIPDVPKFPERCPHGKTHEERKLHGCASCDGDVQARRREELAKMRRENEERDRRSRVVETARAVLPQIASAWIAAGYAGDEGGIVRDAFRIAENFEAAATIRLATGTTDEGSAGK